MVVLQDNRFITIDTPLGWGELLLDDFKGEEKLSGLFSFNLNLLSLRDDIDGKKIVGKQVTLAISLRSGGERYLSGYVCRFWRADRKQGYRRYGAEMMPWLWFLTRRTNSRIFENQSVSEIIEKIFSEYPIAKYQLELHSDYPPRVYCVQYRESDFDFVSRLMEEEGIYYYFKHDGDEHTLILGDNPDGHSRTPGAIKARYHQEGSTEQDDFVHDFREELQIRSGRWSLQDFNFETPKTDLSVSIDTLVEIADVPKLELYDYPGLYLKTPQGDHYAKIRMEEEEWQAQVFSGESRCRGFTAGHSFELSEHSLRTFNQRYVLHWVKHEGRNNYLLEDGSEGGAIYNNCFACFPQTVPFRPLMTTPKPMVQGPQTAIVVGIKGEEIDPDKYGRVKVHFHWEREGKSSCWMRVSHTLAGKNWGAIHIPRIGQEVIVDFLEGDPDRPIISGRVYNADQMPPYDLPANKTQSGIKTRSSKGGGTANFNEVRFEDKKGQEQLYIHAERNQDNVVEHDETTHVGRNRSETVGSNETIHIGFDRNETVGNNETIIIRGFKAETVIMALAESVGLGKAETIGLGKALTIGVNYAVTVGKDIIITAGDSITLTVGESQMVMNKDGSVKIDCKQFQVTGSDKVNIFSKDIDLN